MIRLSTEFNASLKSLNENLAFAGIYNYENIILKSDIEINGTNLKFNDFSAIALVEDSDLASSERVPIKIDIKDTETPLPAITDNGFLVLKLDYNSSSYLATPSLASIVEFRRVDFIIDTDGKIKKDTPYCVICPITVNKTIKPLVGIKTSLSKKKSLKVGLSKANAFMFLLGDEPVLLNERYFDISYEDFEKVINEDTPETNDSSFYTELIKTGGEITKDLDTGDGVTKTLNIAYVTSSLVEYPKKISLESKTFEITNCSNYTSVKDILLKLDILLNVGGVVLAGVLGVNNANFDVSRDFLDLTDFESMGNNKYTNSFVLEIEEG